VRASIAPCRQNGLVYLPRPQPLVIATHAGPLLLSVAPVVADRMAVEIEHFPQIRNSDKCAYTADVPDRIIHKVLIPEAENIGGVHFARRDGGGGLPSPDARGWAVFAMRYRGGDITSVSDGYDELSPGYQTPDVLDVLQMVRG